MTIVLDPQTETKLLDKARREGQDPNAIVNDVLADFLEKDAHCVSVLSPPFALPPEQPGEDSRMAILREIEQRSRFMNPKPSGRDLLREGREGGMFGD